MVFIARVDVHQHVLPPVYRRLLEESGLDAGGWAIPEWDEDRPSR